MKAVVVDASVVVRWLVEDPLASEARAVRESTRGLAPAFVRVETANALSRYVRAGLLDFEDAADAVELVAREVSLVDDGDLLRAAQRLGRSFDHSIYDCLYAALAVRTGLPLVSADMKFVRKAMGVPGLELVPISPDHPWEPARWT